MGESKKTVNVRLPADLAGKFDRLASRVHLPKSVLLRLCLREILDRPIESQIEVVTKQILTPDHDESAEDDLQKPTRNSKSRLKS